MLVPIHRFTVGNMHHMSRHWVSDSSLESDGFILLGTPRTDKVGGAKHGRDGVMESDMKHACLVHPVIHNRVHDIW